MKQHEKITEAMFQALKDTVSSGYTAEKNGEKVKRNGDMMMYSVLRFTLPEATESVSSALDTINSRFRYVQDIPLYREIGIKQLTELRNQIDQTISRMSK